jgi:hypothetical protein
MRTDISTTDTGGITVKRGDVNYKLSPSNFSVLLYRNRVRIFISAGDVSFDEPLGDVYVNGEQLTEGNADDKLSEIHISGGAGGDISNFYDGVNSVTSLQDIPITKHTVCAGITTGQPISLTSGLTVGRTVQVFVKNNSAEELTVTIPTTGSYTSMSGASITIAPGAWIEAHITCYAEGLYNIRVGDMLS